MSKPTAWLGGSFAPPIDEAKMDAYAALAATAEPAIKDAMLGLLKMVRAWWELPESTLPGTKHAAFPRATVTQLEEAHVLELWDLVPWQDELDVFAKRFEALDPVGQKPLRDAAFHLLWFGVELCKDREPITADKLA